MAVRVKPLPLLCLLLLVTFGKSSAQQFIAPCAVGSSDSTAVTSATDLQFHYYKVPTLRGPRANRDFEFLWSDTYRSRYGLDLDDESGTEQLTDLDRLGRLTCDNPFENPFGLDMYDIELVYDFLAQTRTQSLAQRDTLYHRNPNDLIGFRVAQNYPDLEENHIDAYIYAPDHAEGHGYALYAGDQQVYNHQTTQRGLSPSEFVWSAVEDSATGHANSTSYLRNSLSIAGPPPWKVGSQDAVPWTRADQRPSKDLIHESLHAINADTPSGDYEGRINFLHLFARAAELITGVADYREGYELDYTASLWPDDSNESNSYPHWLSFAAYLAFNFRGADTLAAHYEDDLLRRWATRGGSNKLAGLAGRLKDSECPECSGYSEFAGRDSVARLQRLIHNWRVANYVNNATLSGGHYGYPAGYGFSPNYQLRAWESFDGNAQDDTVSVPPVTMLTPADRNQVLQLTERPGAGGSPPRRLELDMFGAEYWVFKADPSLQATQQDLSIRVRAAKLMKSSYSGSPVDWNACQRADYSGRITASVVSYSVAADDLYLHPEWATEVLTQDVVLDQPNQDLVFSVPAFGGAVKAVVVVVTLGDGPEGTYALGNWPPKLPGQPRTYPFELMVMPVATDLPLDPFALAPTARVETSPAWAPLGDSLAFEGIDESGARRIRVAAAIQGAMSRQLAAANSAQYDPAWSPRDHSIAYTQAAQLGRRDLWLVPPAGPAQQLTNMPGAVHDPSFSPTGDRIAYVRSVRTYPPAEDTTIILPPAQWTWSSELRLRVVATGEDVVLTGASGDSTVTNVRWTPDGTQLYFRAVNELGVWHLWRVAVTSPSNWIQSDALAPGAIAFDLAPGIGRMLVTNTEEMGWEPVCVTIPAGCAPCGSGQVFEFGVLGLRDTLAGTVAGLPQETGFPVADARWSPDGTRVALTIAQAGNPDIHVVKTTANRAPLHSQSQTYYQAPACEPWQYMPMATDPDGDPITYEVFGLPPGAISQSNGMIVWQYPVVGNYWMVARALDPQGALASRVIHLEIVDQATCGGGGGEEDPGPDEYGVRGRQAGSNRLIGGGTSGLGRIANSILDGAAGGEWAAQTVRLLAAKSDSVGHARTRLVTVKPGVMKLDRARLLVVDHDPGTVAVATPAGLAVGAKHRAAHVASDAGDDLTQSLKGAEGDARLFAAGSTLSLNWTAGDGIAGLVLDCARASAADPASEWGVRIEVPDGQGWSLAGRIHPRSSYDALAASIAEDTPVRLTFVTDTYVREVAGYSLGESEGGAATVTAVELSGTDVASGVENLASTDEAAVELSEGQGVTLLFDGPAPVAERQRTLFLDLVASFTPEGVSGASSHATNEALPLRFALKGNQPNPFGGGTTIRFDAPRTASVRIDVFDAQGRRVRTLADRSFEPGTHAITWDGTDASGQRVRPGVYLYRMTAPGFRDQRRMVMLGR